MDKRKRSTVTQYILIGVLGIIIVAMVVHIISRIRFNEDIILSSDPTVIDNPLMGFAPDASNTKLCEKSNLVFITVKWNEWEPQEGVFDIEGLEERYNITEWKEQKKHAVIRFMCDIPGDNTHYDIPKWLYEKTGDGTFYNTEYGKGYSPNYSNEAFLKYHKRAIEKLAEYCNQDYFVSFVELGSVGHWGEWHAKDANHVNLMPDSEICKEYVSHYQDVFTNAILLTRRNYDFSVDSNMGLYHDMVGEKNDTDEWISWVKNGASQETSGTPLTLIPTDLGKKKPIGGELTSSVPMETILKDDFGNTLASLSTLNMTFLGPKVPDLTSEEYESACDSMLRRMGYRIFVSEINIRYNFSNDDLTVNLTFKNDGNAGFFFNWPAKVYAFDKDMNPVYSENLGIDLRALNYYDEISDDVHIPITDNMMDEYYIGVEITDPTGQERVELAIDDKGEDAVFVGNAQIIYHYDKDSK